MLIFSYKRIIRLNLSNGGSLPMSPRPVPGSGEDGEQPPDPPVPGNGQPPSPGSNDRAGTGPGKGAGAGRGRDAGADRARNPAAGTGPDPDAEWDGAAEVARLVA